MKAEITIRLSREDLGEAYKNYRIEEIDTSMFYGLIPRWYNKANTIIFIDDDSEELTLKQSQKCTGE